VLQAGGLVGKSFQQVFKDFLLGKWVFFSDSGQQCPDFRNLRVLVVICAVQLDLGQIEVLQAGQALLNTDWFI